MDITLTGSQKAIVELTTSVVQYLEGPDKTYSVPDTRYVSHTIHTTVDDAFTAAKLIDPDISGEVFYGPLEPDPNSITLSDSTLLFVDGDPATITCYYPVVDGVSPSYAWSKDGRTVSSSPDSTIVSLAVNEDDIATYICRVRYEDTSRNRTYQVDNSFRVVIDVTAVTTFSSPAP